MYGSLVEIRQGVVSRSRSTSFYISRAHKMSLMFYVKRPDREAAKKQHHPKNLLPSKVVVVLDYWMGFKIKTGRCARADPQRDHRPVISVLFYIIFSFFFVFCSRTY
jgi:hypothetical protein